MEQLLHNNRPSPNVTHGYSPTAAPLLLSLNVEPQWPDGRRRWCSADIRPSRSHELSGGGTRLCTSPLLNKCDAVPGGRAPSTRLREPQLQRARNGNSVGICRAHAQSSPTPGQSAGLCAMRPEMWLIILPWLGDDMALWSQLKLQVMWGALYLLLKGSAYLFVICVCWLSSVCTWCLVQQPQSVHNMWCITVFEETGSGTHKDNK